MSDSPGPTIEEELRWDTAVAFSITLDTPWDILRAQLLWAIWCQRVEIAFREDHFHLGVILLNAWRNTIYAAMEAYKELFRHARNEEKRQELISCFQQVWTKAEIFGRLRGGEIKWNLTPHKEFLPATLGAWNAPPIRINRLSPSPDPEAEFTARADFSQQVDDFLQGIRNQNDNQRPNPDNVVPQQLAITNSTNNLESAPQHPAINTPHQRNISDPGPSTSKHKSRPKLKCFKRKRTGSKDNVQVITEQPQLETQQQPEARRGAGLSLNSLRRKKVKCTFGPKRVRENLIPGSREEENPPSTTETDREIPHSPPPQSQSSAHPHRLSIQDTTDLDERAPGPSHQRVTIMDRTTLINPIRGRRSPFDNYRVDSNHNSEPHPPDWVLRKLGLSRDEFESEITSEIDDLLQEIETNRRQELLESLPCDRVLSKVDCLDLFQNTGIPPPGPLLGVYNWASNQEAPSP
jgi:hypothetical protein